LVEERGRKGWVDLREAYAYVRVSLREENPENQRLAILAWARENGYAVVRVFEDVGVSGVARPEERPGFSALLEAVRREPRPVLVYELSRLGRSFYVTLEALRVLEGLGAPVIAVSAKESFLRSLDPQVRQLVIAILSWAAERERELLIQRTKEGMLRAKLEGKHVGRPRKEVDLRKVRALRARGVSYADIARILGVSYSTLRRRLREARRRGGPRPRHALAGAAAIKTGPAVEDGGGPVGAEEGEVDSGGD